MLSNSFVVIMIIIILVLAMAIALLALLCGGLLDTPR